MRKRARLEEYQDMKYILKHFSEYVSYNYNVYYRVPWNFICL